MHLVEALALMPLAGWILVIVLWCWVRVKSVKRMGFNGWLGVLWMIPILGWFLKLWLAFTPWPNKGTRTRKAATKTRRRKRRTATSRA